MHLNITISVAVENIYLGFDRYHTDIVMVGRNFEKVFFEVYLFNGKKSILTANYHLDSPILDIQTTKSEGLVTVCKLKQSTDN